MSSPSAYSLLGVFFHAPKSSPKTSKPQRRCSSAESLQKKSNNWKGCIWTKVHWFLHGFLCLTRWHQYSFQHPKASCNNSRSHGKVRHQAVPVSRRRELLQHEKLRSHKSWSCCASASATSQELLLVDKGLSQDKPFVQVDATANVPVQLAQPISLY